MCLLYICICMLQGAPRQTGALTCGLWVMRYMKDIVGDKNQLALAKVIYVNVVF